MASQVAGSTPAVAALGFLLPTFWEIEVTCAAAMILVALYVAYELLNPRSSQAAAAGDADELLVRGLDGADKVTSWVSENLGHMVLVITDADALISRLMDALGLDWGSSRGV
jgi:hypothetical protein